jgi:hypothetical protein
VGPRTSQARDAGAQAFEIAGERAVRGGDGFLFALVGARGGEDRTVAERRLEPLQLVEIDGRRRRVDLQVADRQHIAGAERGES